MFSSAELSIGNCGRSICDFYWSFWPMCTNMGKIIPCVWNLLRECNFAWITIRDCEIPNSNYNASHRFHNVWSHYSFTFYSKPRRTINWDQSVSQLHKMKGFFEKRNMWTCLIQRNFIIYCDSSNIFWLQLKVSKSKTSKFHAYLTVNFNKYENKINWNLNKPFLRIKFF